MNVCINKKMNKLMNEQHIQRKGTKFGWVRTVGVSIADKDGPQPISVSGFKYCLHFQYCVTSYQRKIKKSVNDSYCIKFKSISSLDL